MGLIIGLFIIIGLPIFILCIIFGCKLCNQNNALGILLLFIALNVIGLILVIALLYNAKNKTTSTQESTNTLSNEILDHWEQEASQQNKKEI